MNRTRRDRLIGERVEVRWWDSAGGGGGWVSDHEVKDYPITECSTCGYLVSRDGRQIQMALNRSITAGTKPWGELVAIPMSAVRSIHKVTRTRRVKKEPR